MSITSPGHDRIEFSKTSALLAFGDLALICLFVVIGELQHNNSLTNPDWILNTLVPFFIGWLIAAPLVGAYSRTARSSVKQAVVLTVGSWLPAALIGQLFRATLFGGNLALAFVIVSLLVGTVLLVPWRILALRLFR